MSRRRRADKREVLPDPKFGDLVVTKFMNYVMYEGKKAVAENIMYGAFDILEARRKDLGPLETFHTALDNVAPAIEVRSRRGKHAGRSPERPHSMRDAQRTPNHVGGRVAFLLLHVVDKAFGHGHQVSTTETSTDFSRLHRKKQSGVED